MVSVPIVPFYPVGGVRLSFRSGGPPWCSRSRSNKKPVPSRFRHAPGSFLARRTPGAVPRWLRGRWRPFLSTMKSSSYLAGLFAAPRACSSCSTCSSERLAGESVPAPRLPVGAQRVRKVVPRAPTLVKVPAGGTPSPRRRCMRQASAPRMPATSHAARRRCTPIALKAKAAIAAAEFGSDAPQHAAAVRAAPRRRSMGLFVGSS
jgi:hypothetical protein